MGIGIAFTYLFLGATVMALLYLAWFAVDTAFDRSRTAAPARA